MSQTTQGLAAVAVHASRVLAEMGKPDSETIANGRRLISRVTPETMREFVEQPEVRNGAKGALAVGASVAIPHAAENLLAGTAALRSLGQLLLGSYPSIARILSRNPNAAVVAGTVAFPYVAAPFFEQWFKKALGYDHSGDNANPHPDWRASFMATVANWNHVQPAIGAVLRHHPAALIMAGPLCTGLMNSGADVVNTLENHRVAGASAQGQGERADTVGASDTAAGKAIASQSRYFGDAVRQALKKNPHVPSLATEFMTSNLYPGWVAAMSNLYAKKLAGRIHSSRAAAAAPASNVDDVVHAELDIASMIESPDGRALLEHLAARPKIFSEGPGFDRRPE